MVGQPSFRDSAPYGDLPLRVHVPHEADLELLQRHADVRSDHLVNGPDLSEQIGRQRLVTDGPRTEYAGIDVFGFAHGMLGYVQTVRERFCVTMSLSARSQPPGCRLLARRCHNSIRVRPDCSLAGCYGVEASLAGRPPGFAGGS